jgi:hypothetical protein
MPFAGQALKDWSRRPFPPRLITLAAAAVLLGLLISEAPHASRLPARRPVRRFATSYDARGTFVFGGRPTFPIALSDPPPLNGESPRGANGLDEVVRAGVNLFRVGASWSPWTAAAIARAKEWDQAAARLGVHTWINLNGVARASPGWRVAARLRDTVLSLLTGPSGRAVALWKGADEPALRHIRPASLEFAYCRVTSRGSRRWCAGQRPLDRHHLWVTVESARGSAAALADYTKVTDTHGIDVYPIAVDRDGPVAPDWAPNLHQVGLWTRRLAAITPDHSVWTTLQICASSSFDLRTGRYVLPSTRQERYMVYDAIINGARGLAFFGGNNPHCWTPRDRTRGWNWTFWDTTLEHLITEIGARSPLAPALVDPGSTRRLSTSDPTTQAITRADAPGAGARELWLIAARHGPGRRTVRISGLPPTIGHGVVYPGGRSIRIERGSLTDRFQQWQVHVYRFELRGSAVGSPRTRTTARSR